jgi:unsaturated chondroitin disaccharide hydrolase
MNQNQGRQAEARDLLAQRMRATALEDAIGFPHVADPDTGTWRRSPGGDWTGGFYVGSLWLIAYVQDDDALREQARTWSARLEPRLDSDTVFRGFLFWYGAALGAELGGDEDAAARALRGATAMRGMFDPTLGLAPLGSTAEEAHTVGPTHANIDGLPGTILLWEWAARRFGDERFLDIARLHTDRSIEAFVRADDSVCQSAELDGSDGHVVARYTHKGVSDTSTWTRAQAWAMLGLAHACARLGSDYDGVATRIADWWVEHLPDDGVAWWDFDAAGSLRDTSGSAIGAAALLKLAAHLPGRADVYRATAVRTVDRLIERHLVPTSSDDDRPVGMLVDGCYDKRNGRATRHELIWGDYFLLESLLMLEGHDVLERL